MKVWLIEDNFMIRGPHGPPCPFSMHSSPLLNPKRGPHGPPCPFSMHSSPLLNLRNQNYQVESTEKGYFPFLLKQLQICDYGCSDSEDAKTQRRCFPLQDGSRQYEQLPAKDISHCLVAKKCLYAAEVEEAKMYTALCNPQTVDSFVILESAAESLRTRLQGTGSLEILTVEMKKPSKKTKVNNIAVYRLEAEFSSMPLHYIVDSCALASSSFGLVEMTPSAFAAHL
ncbi:hypothetical protein M513_12193 [Trichuris suis]|uniref:Uncharacterized protein n=1 Tax=Trichuris suis TaxID=68888 RepID=A0A085LPQ1_9BILA|nr:hypothetical protein M513_12193 [Trichuris suis]